MDRPTYLQAQEETESPRSLPLVVLVLILAASGAFLYVIAGPPHLPARFPTWTEIVVTLEGTDVPLEAFAYLFTTASWLLWIWIAASLLLRFLVVGAETVSRGAAWAASLRAASDRLTLPIVRRVVDGAVVAVIVVNLVSRAPAASAAPLEAPAAMVARSVPWHPDAPTAVSPTPLEASTNEAAYTVQPGDTLWSIAQRFYGTGEEFPRLVDANAGRRMPDGRVFTRAGVIQPGWILRIPLPSHAVAREGKQTYYVVEKGDTLRGIAARFLGDENRWPAIFDLNRGTARLSDGRVLEDPDLIWPGLRLRLPEAPPPVAANPPPPPQPEMKPVPVPRSEPPSPHLEPSPVVPLSPSPIPATPASTAIATPRPTPSRTVEPTPVSTTNPRTSVGTYAAMGLAAAVVGGGAWLARQHARRRLGESAALAPPIHRPPCDDFAEAEFARTLAYRLQSGDVEPITAVGARVLHFLEEHGIDDVAVILAQQSQIGATLILRTGIREQEKLEDLTGEIGAWLGGKAVITPTPDHDVLLQLGATRLAAVIGARPDRVTESLGLVPLGLLPDGDTLFANWRELGNVLVAGLPGGGVEIILTSVVCALAARCHPEELRLWTIAGRRSLPAPLAGLPHQVDGIVAPAFEGDITEVLDRVRAELLCRMARRDRDPSWSWRPTRDEPEIVLLAGEFDTLIDDGTTLELLGTHGPAYGVRLLVGSTRGDGIRDEFLPIFSTRLVLQTLDDDESILLLGQPDAAELGNAEYYLRIDGRIPVRLRGFRVSESHLDELIRLMGDLPTSSGILGEDSPPEATVAFTGGDAIKAEVASTGATALPTDAGAGSEAGCTGNDPFDVNPDTSQLIATPGDASPLTNGPTVAQDVSAADDDDAEPGVAAVDRSQNGHWNGHQNGMVPKNGSPDTHSAITPVQPAETASSPSGAVDDGAANESRPLLYVRCLGDFAAQSGDREVTPTGEEGATYQGWEILAFLAVHPNGEVTKDRLLAALWPDVPTERAIKRMHAALVRLRPLLIHQIPGLTGDFVRTDRDGTVRFDPTLVTSDAQVFLALEKKAERLAVGDARDALERARELYRGDLLIGRGARFCDWVDERADDGTTLRERFRDKYDRMSLRLAEIYRKQGHPERAIPLYRSLLKTEPTLEDVVRDLFRCCGQLGDLASLIREERRLRQALREAYADPNDPDDDPNDYQPEPETTALFKEIRAKLEGNAHREHVNGRPTSPSSRVRP